MLHVLPLIVAVHTSLADAADRIPTPARLRARDDAGQTTAEYALVLLGAAAIAVLIISWATKTNLIGKLFDFVIDRVMGKAG